MDDDEIKITILEDDDLPIHHPEHPKEMFPWHSPTDTGVRVVCSRRVFEAVEKFSKENKDKEVGGVLLGTAYRHDGDIYVEVSKLVKAPNAAPGQSGLSHFTFTDHAWAEMWRIRDTQYEKLKVVGWFHSHPGHRVFLSTDDLNIQNNHFKSPWHVAMVYDPIYHEGGFFVWDRGKIVPSGGFYELLDPDQKKSALTWKKPSSPTPPPPPPQKTAWWKDPWEWVAALMWSIVLFGILLGFFLTWRYGQEVNIILAQQQNNSEAQKAEIAALKKTLVAVERKIPTAIPTSTPTVTITPTGTVTLASTNTFTPTITITLLKTLSPTPTLSATITETLTPTDTPTVTLTLRVTETITHTP